MLYSNVLLSNLKTYDECDKAIDSIESDYHNVVGGFKSWNSGKQTFLLKGAETKIKAIKNKQDRLFINGLKKSYEEYAKTNPNVSWEEYYDNELYA
ncbi:TPA: hypothetical protein NGW16_004191 [Vibrio parahaemolyticus]|nr:hypothetical protein [Vibrio cholerae]HCE4999455.1 hypothetical protein [Vibrio parahaemolyticus]